MHEHTSRYSAAQEKKASDRSFGFVFAGVFLIVALLPLVHKHSLRFWALLTSALFLAIALRIPHVLAPLNRLWTKFGVLLHHIVSPVALAILFYGSIVPTRLFLRVLGKDPLRLRFDRSAKSYWIERTPAGPDAESFKNQF